MNHKTEIDYDEDGRFKRLTTWHPIDGVWIRIEQRLIGNKMEYYTDGALSGVSDLEKMESVPC